MNKGRFTCILSGLSRYELTSLEKRFIEAAKHCMEEQGRLTEEQESILESLYLEKTRWIKKGLIHLAKNSTQTPLN
jgi:hypothetical protein